MPWFNVDDSFHSHPKVLATSLAARGLWATAGSWSSAHLTDGVVPDHVLASLGGTPELASELVAAGLWKRTRGAHVFHDWADRNESKEVVLRKRAQSAERQRRHRAGLSESNGVSHALVTRDKRVSHSAQSNPIQSVVDVINQASGSLALPPDDDPILRSVIDSIHQRTGQVLGATEARGIAAGILGQHQVNDPAKYLATAIIREPDPAARWLKTLPKSPNPRPPWCGKCDETSRLTDEDTPRRCPDCHPKSVQEAT